MNAATSELTLLSNRAVVYRMFNLFHFKYEQNAMKTIQFEWFDGKQM